MNLKKTPLIKENVWDYPRPPALEKITNEIKIIFNNEILAQSTNSYRILETSHPPVYYIPVEDVKQEFLKPTEGTSFCEWKGIASYYDVQVKEKLAKKVAWDYPKPTKRYIAIKNHIAFYAEPMDACYVDEEKVIPQPGNFYGGWITKNLVGPFKGTPGSLQW